MQIAEGIKAGTKMAARCSQACEGAIHGTGPAGRDTKNVISTALCSNQALFEMVKRCQSSVQPGMWTVTVDLSDTYYHIG